ncbi:hypothetical protein [Hyphomonas johnsonii]|uniref:Uncharacterized protein n=1 Tax=Hyphomonas johnsonii MHS-2 TaxID=1280950 RepID=A0A059FSA9_9PROT|nr:hypothetical protein [Hyphomonas johnsonii]KCZ93524.1 hypothetical protein HJO_06705 [Hyphomonas johnsonii MHS-2]
MLGAVDRWLRRFGPLIVTFGTAVLLCGLMLFWLFGPNLAPFFKPEFPFAFQFDVETWHWIAAWGGLWTALSLGIGRVGGRRRGIIASGFLAMFMGAGTWAVGQTTYLDFSKADIAASAISAFWIGWLVFQFARLELLWSAPAPDHDTTRQPLLSLADGRDFTENFAYTFLSLFGLALDASQRIWPGAELASRKAIGQQFTPSLVFAILIVTAFLPLLTGFWLRASRDAKRQKQSFWRKDVVTPLWFALISTSVLGITLLAYYAALYASDTISAAISYATFVGVFLVFVMVIVLPHVMNYYRRRSEDSIAAYDQTPIQPMGIATFDAPALWLSYLDTLLVKVVAPLSGGTQRRFAHGYVILTLCLLSLLGLVIPRPFGLVPVVIGILLAIALGRRWAWVEEDRETASRLESTRGSNIHLGFENDLKDEALTGYAGLFILVPLTLYQIQDITGFEPIFDEQPGNILLTWIVFFGGELAKAVPFVDWWDIYGNSEVSSTGKHLTFLSRAAVDLVIMAALFQALNIWQRNRVQSMLFKDGHLDAFDPFKEKEFFQDGIVRLKGTMPQSGMDDAEDAKARSFETRVEELRKAHRLFVERTKNGHHVYYEIRKSFEEKIVEHVKQRERLLIESSSVYESPAPYSRQRLAELIDPSQHEDLRAGAQWMIERWNVLVGRPIDKLGQIARRWETLNFPDAFDDEKAIATRARRIQKMEFEKILVELADPQWSSGLRKKEISDLMQCLRRVRADVEFDFSRILSFELFGRMKTVYAVMFLSKFVLTKDHLDDDESWRLRLIAHAEGPDTEIQLGRAAMRARVYDSAARIACNHSAGDQARRDAFALLDWMSRADGSKSGRSHASMRALEVQQFIAQDGLFGVDS